MKKNTKKQIKKGFGFGLTSGVITTLGLIVGLYFSTHSKMLVIGGILMIAVADSMSDALGIHIAEEFDGKNSFKDIWVATGSTFLFKFTFALLFIVWFLFFDTGLAVLISVIWGALLIVAFSYYLAKSNKVPAYEVILEHIVIMSAVIVVTYFVGSFIDKVFI